MTGKVHPLLIAVLATPLFVTAAVAPVASGQTSRAAHRTSVTLADARGDVYKWKYQQQPHRVTRNHLADIDRVRVSHNHQFVVVRTKLFHLRREGSIEVWTHLHTNELSGRYAALIAAKGYWHGIVGVRAGFHGLHRCETSHNIDYVNDVMTLRLSRSSCLSDPRWIQAHVFVTFHRHGCDYCSGWFDNAHTEGRPYKVGWTPRLYRAAS
jgi:hypothetical protein